MMGAPGEADDGSGDRAADRGRRLVDRVMGGTFALLTLALLIVAAARCWHSDIRALAATLQDDSYYYLLPAFHLKEHGIWTFDGEHPTYGSQPLFALLLAALGSGFEDRFEFLRAALWTTHVLVVLASALLVVVVRRIARPCGAARAALLGWLAGGLYLFSPVLLFAQTTLKENCVYAVVLTALLLALLRVRERPAPRRHFLLGWLVGLSLLARIMSSTFAVAAVVIWWSRPRPCRRGVPAVVAGFLLATAPWAVYALCTFGRILPTPGAIKTAWLRPALANGELGAHLMASLRVVPDYVVSVVRFASGHDSRFHAPQWWTHAGGIGLAAWVVTGLLAVLLASCWHRRHLLRTAAAARLLVILLLAAMIASAVNPLVLDAGSDATLLFYAQWYIAAEPVLLTALAVLGLAWLPRSQVAPPRWQAYAGAVVLIAVGLPTCLSLGALTSFSPLPSSMVHQEIAMVERANESLPVAARLGAGNAGVAGFFSTHTLVNLDGLANDDVVAARQRNMSRYDYVRQQRIDYMLDMLPQRGGWFGDNPFDHLQLVDALPLCVDYHVGIYLARVVDDRFPDFEPEQSTAWIEVHPWLQPSPVGRPEWSWRNFRLRPGPERLVFFTAGRFAELQATLAAAAGSVRVLGDGQLLQELAVGSAPMRLHTAVQGVQVVEVEAVGEQVWLADVGFATATSLPAPMLAAGRFGRGSLVAGGGGGSRRR